MRPDWLGLRPAWQALGPSRGGTDGRTNERTENLPILQDFVPYRGRCPATAQLQPKNCIKRGKGTADHMMPLGDWFANHLRFNQDIALRSGPKLKILRFLAVFWFRYKMVN